MRLFALLMVAGCAAGAPAPSEVHLAPPEPAASASASAAPVASQPAPEAGAPEAPRVAQNDLRIDVQEGIKGHLTIAVEGVTLFSQDVSPVSLVGHVASVVAHPKQWPAEVTVRGPKGTKNVRVPRATPFVAVSGPALDVTMSAKPFEYE